MLALFVIENYVMPPSQVYYCIAQEMLASFWITTSRQNRGASYEFVNLT